MIKTTENDKRGEILNITFLLVPLKDTFKSNFKTEMEPLKQKKGG